MANSWGQKDSWGQKETKRRPLYCLLRKDILRGGPESWGSIEDWSDAMGDQLAI